MTLSRPTASVLYGLIALLALVGTWGNNMQYLDLGLMGANLRFWQDTLANPAGRSITVDVIGMFLAASVWMCMEARRLGMKGAWLYVVLGLLIAISVTYPVFMLNRERALAKREGGDVSGELGASEVALLVLSAVFACAYTTLALSR
jgi:hypothetical protein